MTQLNDVIMRQAGSRLLLLGNEAIARGAIEAGVRVAAAYPGTPSSEIVETLAEVATEMGFYAEWSVNEKVSFELATGAAVIGARALVAMKGAGLNVIMDMFLTLPYTGTRGGLVVVVADDPGAHYSSNEQDSRFAALWAGLPCLEPEGHQEAKDMKKAAFGLSERMELPVVVRTGTRLSHSSGVVELGQIEDTSIVLGFNKHWKIPYRWNVYGPPGPEAKHAWQLARLPLLQSESSCSPFNQMRRGGGTQLAAVVVCGMGAAYAREAMRHLDVGDRIWLYKIGMVYPVPEGPLLEVLRGCDRMLVVEDGGPLVESQLRTLAQTQGARVKIAGQMLDGAFARHGELNTVIVRETMAEFLGISVADDDERKRIKDEVAQLVIPRSSALCAGCPHLGTYWALRRALASGRLSANRVPIVNGDIGCYEQAGYGVKGQRPPAGEVSDAPSARYGLEVLYDFLDTLYVMGSGVSMAQGQVRAGYQDGQVVAVAGDSTFFHTCMPGLLNAVWNGTKLTFVVMDNRWTAMTGHQVCPATGLDARGQPAKTILVEDVARALGVESVEVVDPYDLSETEQAIRRALEFDGPAVVVARRECLLQVLRREREAAVPAAVTDDCVGCGLCIELGCPAVVFQDDQDDVDSGAATSPAGGRQHSRASIDPLLCAGCGICAQLCPSGAIVALAG